MAGSQGSIIGGSSGGGGAASMSYAKVSDTKAANTAGGSSSAGAFRTRDLNTIDSDDDSIVSLSTNQISLGEGTYRVRGHTLTHATGNIKSRIRNITDSSDTIIGSNGFQSTAGIATYSFVEGQFTIASTKTFEFQIRTSLSRGTDGLGLQVNLGVSEVYTVLEIWKVG